MPLTLTPAASTVFPRRTGSSESFSQTSTYRRPAVTKRLSSIVAVDSALCPSRWSRWTWTVMFPRGTETSLPATSMSSPCSSGAVKQPMKVSASAEPTTDSTLSVTAHSATFASSRNREAASPAIETSLPSKVTLRPGDSWRSARTRTSRVAANPFCDTRRSPEVAVLIIRLEGQGLPRRRRAIGDGQRHLARGPRVRLDRCAAEPGEAARAAPGPLQRHLRPRGARDRRHAADVEGLLRFGRWRRAVGAAGGEQHDAEG